jgi:hypothetical protein
MHSYSLEASLHDLVEAFTESGMEGIIAKRCDTLAEPGKRVVVFGSIAAN